MSEFKTKLIDYLLSEKFSDKDKIDTEDFDAKFKKMISLINNNAPVKTIYKNRNEEDIILVFNEIKKEIETIELRKRIDSLEDKVSMNLDENLYSELLSLRNQLKEG